MFDPGRKVYMGFKQKIKASVKRLGLFNTYVLLKNSASQKWKHFSPLANRLIKLKNADGNTIHLNPTGVSDSLRIQKTKIQLVPPITFGVSEGFFGPFTTRDECCLELVDLNGVTLHGRSGAFLDSKGLLLPDISCDPGRDDPRDHGVFEQFPRRRATMLDSAFAAVGTHSTSNFGHFLCSVIAKVQFAVEGKYAEQMPILVPDFEYRQFHEALSELFPNVKFLICDEHRPFHVKHLLTTPSADCLSRPSSWAIDLAARAFADSQGWTPNDQPGSHGILISRATTKVRRLLNEDAILRALQAEMSFELIHMDRLSVVEQANSIRNASAIIGTAGANMSLVGCATKGVPIIELQPDTALNFGTPLRMSMYTLDIAERRGKPYGLIAGESISGTDRNADFQVDPSVVLTALRTLVQKGI